MSLGLGLMLGAVAVKPAAAQSTIFNIPSTDTVAPKKAYFEFDYLPEMPAPDGGRFQIFTPRIVFGITDKVEAGFNISNTHVPDATFSLFQPDVKYKFYADDKKGLAAAAGAVWYVPMNHRDEAGTFGLVYANISKKMPGDHGPRVTIGPYGVIAKEDDFSGKKGGILGGYEQPLTKTVSFVADWFSGQNFFGYFTPGISVTLPHSGLLNIGYSFGNDSFGDPSNDNRALFVYYGITFP
jgi:hypothetical protein